MKMKTSKFMIKRYNELLELRFKKIFNFDVIREYEQDKFEELHDIIKEEYSCIKIQEDLIREKNILYSRLAYQDDNKRDELLPLLAILFSIGTIIFDNLLGVSFIEALKFVIPIMLLVLVLMLINIYHQRVTTAKITFYTLCLKVLESYEKIFIQYNEEDNVYTEAAVTKGGRKTL